MPSARGVDEGGSRTFRPIAGSNSAPTTTWRTAMMESRKGVMAAAVAMMLLAASGCASTYQPSPVEHVAVSEPNVSVNVNYFYGDLAPYGRWIEYGPYGWCWTPY